MAERERWVKPPHRSWKPKDPFRGVWWDVLAWQQEGPDAYAVVLLIKLQAAKPDRFDPTHLRTLQWRGIMANNRSMPGLQPLCQDLVESRKWLRRRATQGAGFSVAFLNEAIEE